MQLNCNQFTKYQDEETRCYFDNAILFKNNINKQLHQTIYDQQHMTSNIKLKGFYQTLSSYLNNHSQKIDPKFDKSQAKSRYYVNKKMLILSSRFRKVFQSLEYNTKLLNQLELSNDLIFLENGKPISLKQIEISLKINNQNNQQKVIVNQIQKQQQRKINKLQLEIINQRERSLIEAKQKQRKKKQIQRSNIYRGQKYQFDQSGNVLILKNNSSPRKSFCTIL